MTAFALQRITCGYFFAVPGIAYGIFTARMPALKAMVAADDTDIGFLLLGFGAASFIGLTTCGRALNRFGAKPIIGLTCIIIPLAMCVAGLAYNYWQLLAFCLVGGLASGFCEVAMNAQGMLIEQKFNRLCMSSLHACFSLGGMAGSLFGSLFAWLSLSPAINFLLIGGAYLCLLPLAYTRLKRYEIARGKNEGQKSAGRIPPFIYFCGLISMLCYVSEGSVGEWGSILLHSVKGAAQDQAALVFACFCLSMVIFRFLGDRLRESLGDVKIVFFGGLLAASCMSVVLLVQSPPVCLAAYAVMGVGFAPIVPILFSRAGKTPGLSQAKASSTISIMSYTGLLVFPPFLGMLGDRFGLGRALWIIVVCCLGVAIGGSLLLNGKNRGGRGRV